ncbi:peptidoglycan DD-metalloendopeptidase family protein [Clostridium sp. AN503]|uniref:murein hydrolase activator EnvC family protein n=1 Tax=Clostridium sp. AN503 TaxID=3160598 RepID=UPI00345814FF
MRRERKRQLASAVLALLLAVAGISPVYATKQDVEDAKKKVSSLEQEKKKVEDSLKNLEGLKSDAAAYVKQLDGNLEALNGELEQLAGQIAAKESDIDLANQQLDEAKAVEHQQYEDMKLRIKYMYERGETSYIDMLLQADDMVQLMNRAEYIQKISEYDRQKMDEYVATKDTIAAHEQLLQSEHAELLGLQEQTEAKQQSVETLLAQKSRELKNFENQIDAAQGQISEYEKDLKAQEGRIQQLEAEIKRKEEEARKAAEAAGKSYKTVSLGNINFIWPCPSSSRITSGFGGRSSPTEGASSNHQGIDIGASSGSAIIAAASGTVVVSTYSYSAGNYIMLSHGGGVYTVYMHCSQLLVSEGQEVSQGQTIAKVGSTGYSTGPHLHFGVRTGGRYVDPRNYVSP